jgi:phosphoribosylamine-glycine ligase
MENVLIVGDNPAADRLGRQFVSEQPDLEIHFSAGNARTNDYGVNHDISEVRSLAQMKLAQSGFGMVVTTSQSAHRMPTSIPEAARRQRHAAVGPNAVTAQVATNPLTGFGFTQELGLPQPSSSIANQHGEAREQIDRYYGGLVRSVVLRQYGPAEIGRAVSPASISELRLLDEVHIPAPAAAGRL